MTTPFNRTLFGAIALLFAAASFDVSGALAQATVGTGEVTSTICGPGTETQCGTENLVRCEFVFEFQFNPMTKGGGISFGSQVCKSVGTRNLYKDTRGALGSCTPPIGSGRTTGSTGGRGGSDDEFGDESCE